MMARKKENPVTEATETAVESVESPSTTSITIQGLSFSIPQPYAVGHVLTEVEAGALNQTFAENIRNNMAGKVKKAKEAATEAGTELDEATLRSEIDEYISTYSFATKRATRTPTDPVEKLANKLASEAIKGALKARGYDLKSVTEDQFDTLVANLLASDKGDAIKAEAKRQHDAKLGTAGDIFESLGLPAAAE